MSKNNIKICQGGVTSPKGFLADGIVCGIKKNGKKDLSVIFSEIESKAAGVFTKNQFAAAPVLYTKKILKNKTIKAIIINSGNANAATGKKGLENIVKICDKAANVFNVPKNKIGICSTGVIGVDLPVNKIIDGLGKVSLSKTDKKGTLAAEAILTTDKVKKEHKVSFYIDKKKITIGGMAKGAGMIQPNMATMIAVLTTDLNISPVLLQKALKQAVEGSFNIITVDGDESTNDTVIIMANGCAGNRIVSNKDARYDIFAKALSCLCVELAKDIVRDAEGATKFVEILVDKASSEKSALCFARTVANSNLVKTALYGMDPNWGRIIAALGSVRYPLKQEKVNIYFNDCQIVRSGLEIPNVLYKAKKILAKKEIVIRISLNTGKFFGRIWTSDLTHDYVTINASYRS